MTKRMSPALQARMHANVTAAVELREATAAARFHAGFDPLPITVCLGPGRCLMGSIEKEGGSCAFCTTYPTGPGSAKRANEIANRVIAGN